MNNLLLTTITVRPGATVTLSDDQGEVLCVDVLRIDEDGTVQLQLRQLREIPPPAIGRFIDALELFDDD